MKTRIVSQVVCPMKIIVSNAIEIEFRTKVDLLRLIPEGVDGNVLNYSEGEGQVLIGDSVWGIYSADKEIVVLKYEQGLIEFLTLLALTSRIIDKLKREFSQDLVFKVEGMLERQVLH